MRALAKMQSKNPKLRGMCKKLTAHAKSEVRITDAVSGVEIDDWEILLGNEVIKGAPALLELYANSVGGVTFTKAGQLVANGAVVTQVEFDQWVRSNTKRIVIEQLVDVSVYELYKDEAGVQFTANGDGTYTMSESCDAVIGVCHYGIELSSSFENYGTSELGLPEQMALSLMNPFIGSKLICLIADYKIT